ncbi:MAG TPA: serine hydrolase domain-containing protein [Steroidobacteraceae bacterium]|jgi:CubicO group peptidase (beta-lactamase class C family)
MERSVSPMVTIKGESLPRVSLAERMRQLHVVGVSIAVFNRGKIEWTKAYGFADKERGVAATPETLFLAGSISKPVAALGALELVDKGVLELDANVNDKLKTWKLPDNEFTTEHKVTLRNILNHTAGTTVWGFVGYTPPAKIPSTIEVLDGKGNTPAIRVWKVPGESWRYSGGGYTIMQQLVCDVTGETFPELMSATVFKPLHMNSSTYEQPLPEGWRARAASGYDESGVKILGGWRIYPEMAAAGLWTTASDLARYALAVERAYRGAGGILSPKMAHLMLTPGMANHGLGPVITPDGKRFGHTGVDAGFQASVTAYLQGGAGAVVLTNSGNGLRLADELMLTIAREYGWSGFPENEKTVVHLAPYVYERLAGHYRYQGDPGVGEFEISFKDGHLLMKYPDASARELLAESETRYFDRVAGTEIETQAGSTTINVIGIGHAAKLP